MSIHKISSHNNELYKREVALFIVLYRKKKINRPNSHKFSILQLTKELFRKFGLEVHQSTIRRHLIKLNLYGPWERKSHKRFEQTPKTSETVAVNVTGHFRFNSNAGIPMPWEPV